MRIRHLNNILKLIAVLGELINKHTAMKIYFYQRKKQIFDPPEVWMNEWAHVFETSNKKA